MLSVDVGGVGVLMVGAQMLVLAWVLLGVKVMLVIF